MKISISKNGAEITSLTTSDPASNQRGIDQVTRDSFTKLWTEPTELVITISTTKEDIDAMTKYVAEQRAKNAELAKAQAKAKK